MCVSVVRRTARARVPPVGFLWPGLCVSAAAAWGRCVCVEAFHNPNSGGGTIGGANSGGGRRPLNIELFHARWGGRADEHANAAPIAVSHTAHFGPGVWRRVDGEAAKEAGEWWETEWRWFSTSCDGAVLHHQSQAEARSRSDASGDRSIDRLDRSGWINRSIDRSLGVASISDDDLGPARAMRTSAPRVVFPSACRSDRLIASSPRTHAHTARCSLAPADPRRGEPSCARRRRRRGRGGDSWDGDDAERGVDRPDRREPPQLQYRVPRGGALRRWGRRLARQGVHRRRRRARREQKRGALE